MIRGYAVGLGAGTQVLVSVPWFLIVGMPGELARALLLSAGWVINLAVAERVIRRRPASPVRAAELLTVRANVGNASHSPRAP
ncbi:DUF2306 domain-containing protein [Pyxidicoccus sp. QH1ED-7-1]|nr:DUF2306 domain-containing protein [Pyxidicoccus xibeiensis]